MQQTKDLTNGPIKRQLFNLAIPIMGTSFIQMAYSLTDMAWVGRLGGEAVAAIGAVGILAWMTASIAMLTKVGSEVSVAQSIGGRNEADARKYASHNITIGCINALCLGVLLFVFAHPVIRLFKLDASITDAAVDYLRIITAAFPFVFLSYAFTGIHNAAGLSKIPFYINGIGLVMNMALDPLFILGFGWGTGGAAWATWISQATVCLLFVYQLNVRNRLFGGFSFFTRLEAAYTKRVIQLGLPVAVLNTLFAAINLVMGRTASTYGGYLGLTTMTAGGQIEAIAWNTSQGFSTALSAFTAQNYAAKKKERLQGAYYATLTMTSLLGLCCTVLFVCWGSEVFSLIVPEREAYLAGGVFLRIDGYSMLFMMIEITMQGLFYGTGRTIPPAIISVAFNALRIPSAILLSSWMGVTGVWWAMSISSMLKGITAFVWFRFLRKKMW
jgi:putative MATE family efflux protein